MIKKIRIKNFKCLRDTGYLDIKPLTFFVGPNSSGKSSLFQILLMLKQTVENIDPNNPLIVNGNWAQMGSYPEFIYKGDSKNELDVEIEFFDVRSERFPFNKPYSSRTSQLKIRTSFCYNIETTQINIKEILIQRGKNEFQKVIRKGSNYIANISYIIKKKEEQLTFEEVKPYKFYDFMADYRKLSELFEKKEYLSDRKFYFGRGFEISRIVDKQFENLYYLGPLRQFPQRIYITSGQRPGDVGIRGQHAVDVLWFSHLSKNERIKKINKECIKWFKEFGFADNIELENIGIPNYYQVVITDPFTKCKTNLLNIGFGASQTLPIIIESFYAPKNSLILIEQPEIHLHPKAQASLGDLFISSVTDSNRNLIVETHSEHILSRVRRKIAEKVIDKDKVAIYYFNPTENGTKIEEIVINENGQYVSFPDGFFEEGILEAFEHLKAIKNNGKK